MKTTNKMDGDAFARGLAKCASPNQTKHIIIAQEAVDLKDEAKQSAQSYWMMGWTWDEIESVLEDSEYPKSVITYAIKETKEYAKKVLNEGPFSVLKMGQEVKLANGATGILLERYADHLVIDVSGIGTTSITANQLDIKATGQLREAYALRRQAANMLYKLSTDQLEHISVESQELDPILASVDNALAAMSSIQQSSDEVKREAAKLHDKWEEDVGTWAPKSAEEQEFAEYVQVTLTGENQLDEEIADVFHAKLGFGLAALHDALRQGTVLTDETTLDFLNNVYPNITENLEGHLYGVKQRNAKMREYVQQFAKFGKEKADWKDSAVQFAVSSWDLTKEFMERWEDQIAPSIEKGNQAISSVLMNVGKQQVKASVQQALKVL